MSTSSEKETVKDVETPIVTEVYRHAVEHSPIATSITDTNANIMYVNPAFEELTGYGDDILGKNESVLSDKATPIEIYKTLWSTITNGKVWKGRLVNQRKDGSRYLAELTVVPVEDDNGDVLHYMGMHRDVTDLHQLERKVKNQDALISSVVEAAPVVIVLVDMSGRVGFSNPAYKELNRELGQDDAATKFIEGFSSTFGMTLEELCQRGSAFSAAEVGLEMPHGETRWFACSASKVEEQDMSATGYFDRVGYCGVLLVASDITHQRRRYEQARTNAVRALMAEQQMVQGMREVMSGAIFQLQGPLNVMSAAVGMMKRQGKEADGLCEPIKQVLEAGEQALGRLKTSMPRTANEAVVPININEIIREVLDISIEEMLREGVLVEWHPVAVVPNVPGRANALRSLVKYLVDNAIMAVKDGTGTREVRIDTRVTDAGDVSMEVRDTGPGFDDSILLKAYEPFFTAWTKTKSRPGLGLHLARQIITDQGGSIEIGSTMTGGGRVEVVFAAGSLGRGSSGYE